MTPNQQHIRSYQKYLKAEQAETAKDNDLMTLQGSGELAAKLTVDKAQDINFDLIHAPELTEPLLSVSQTADLPNVKEIVFRTKKVSPTLVDGSYVRFNDNSRVPLVRKDGLY